MEVLRVAIVCVVCAEHYMYSTLKTTAFSTDSNFLNVFVPIQQLAFGLSVGDLACHTSRSLVASSSTATTSSSSGSSHSADSVDKSPAPSCELSWRSEAMQQTQASKARALLERLYPDLRQQVHTRNI